MANQVLKTALLIVASLIVGYFLLDLITHGGHAVANIAGHFKSKM